MSNTLKVYRVVPVYRQVVLAKVMSWNSSLPEVDKPYRKSDCSHRKCRRVVTTRHELTRLVTFRSRLDFVARNALADKRNKTRPRSANLRRQVIRFNETRVQETKLCIPKRSHAMYTSFLNVCRRVIPFTRNTRVNKSIKPQAHSTTKSMCKQDRNPRTQCILRSINFCRQVYVLAAKRVSKKRS